MKQLNEKIQLSKDGVTFSYYRFVAETTPGLFLNFLFTIALIARQSSTHTSKSEQTIWHAFNAEWVVLIAIFLFVTAPFVGLLITSLSFMLFGWLEALLVPASFSVLRSVTPLVNKMENCDDLFRFFQVDRKNFLKKGYQLQRILEFHGSDKITVNTRRTALRNFALLAVAVPVMLNFAMPNELFPNLILYAAITQIVFVILLVNELYLQMCRVFAVAYHYINASSSLTHMDYKNVIIALDKKLQAKYSAPG